MARTLRDSTLDSRTARLRLSISGKPYYRSLEKGLHLGYRRGKTAGRWVARYYVGDQTYRVETLGTADDFSDDADGIAVLNFAQAQEEARKRFHAVKRTAAGAEPLAGPYTVAACVEDYLKWMEAKRKTAKDSRYRAEAHIIPTLGAVECSKLTKKQIDAWLTGMVDLAPRLRTRPGKEQKYREVLDVEEARRQKSPDLLKAALEAKRRRQSTANRNLTVLKAALNAAWRDGKIATDAAWRPVEPFPEADAARVRWLSSSEVTRLLNACDGEFKHLVQGALLTGARYQELARATVGDFNPNTGKLFIPRSKSGRERHVVLSPDEGVPFFLSLVAGKEYDALIFPRADGQAWGAAHQIRPMKEACRRARIKNASFHTLRHTYASHSVMRMPLLLLATNLGHADTRMCERNYAHLSDNEATKAIRETSPRFGISPMPRLVAVA